MPLVNKLSSGRIFSDEFADSTINPIWQVSPTDPSRYSVNGERAGYLRLKHGDTPLYILMDMPNKDFVMEIKNDYLPIIDKDTAGIIVYRDAVSRIELIEYFDASTGTSVNFSHMRVMRRGDVYTGYGSKDNGATWQMIGTGTAQDMTKIGLVINGETVTNAQNFDVDYVKIYEDTRFVVGNLTPGMKVELLNSSNAVIATQVCSPNKDHVHFDLALLPMPFNGKMKVYQGTVLKETTASMDIWGGDVFWYGLLVDVYYQAVKLPKDTETPLGYMVNGIIEALVTIKNPGMEPIDNVEVSKGPYFDYRGADWVKIAEDTGAGPGEYKDSVNIGLLNPGESRNVWIKIKKEYTGSFAAIGNYKFLLQVTN